MKGLHPEKLKAMVPTLFTKIDEEPADDRLTEEAMNMKIGPSPFGTQLGAAINFVDTYHTEGASNATRRAWLDVEDHLLSETGLAGREGGSSSFNEEGICIPLMRGRLDVYVNRLLGQAITAAHVRAEKIDPAQIKRGIDLELLTEAPATILIRSALMAKEIGSWRNTARLVGRVLGVTAIGTLFFAGVTYLVNSQVGSLPKEFSEGLMNDLLSNGIKIGSLYFAHKLLTGGLMRRPAHQQFKDIVDK